MNFSAEKACRKWSIAALGRRKATIKAAIKATREATWGVPISTVAAALMACLMLAEPALAARRGHSGLLDDLFGDRPVKLRGTLHSASEPVPLPKPRPAEAPTAAPQNSPTAKAAPDAPDKPDGPAATATRVPAPNPQPSACRLALTGEIAIAPSIPDIHDPGGCGGEDLVRLEAVVLPDKHRVLLKPAATLRCGMAAALADWVRTEVEPLAEGAGSELSELDNFDSYECRGRNRVAGAQLSEHGRANAIDVRGWKLADGQSVGLTDRNVPRDLRETVLHSVCARFMTVLGPGSDGYHEDHIHLDLMERHNNYKICQWNVWDPMPQIAPLMPSERPAEAPPRQVADHATKDDEAKPEGKPAAKSDTTKPKPAAEPQEEDADSDDAEKAKSQSGKPEAAKPESGQSQPDKPTTKKRRQDRRS